MNSAEWLLFQQLFRSQVEAVFRYHLIWTCDWRLAEARTSEIFDTALAWFSPQVEQNESLTPWLWQIVRGSQNRRSIQFIEPKTSLGAEIPQNQLRSFACAAQVTREWKSLPHRVIEAMGLFYFGHLEIQQVAVLTHMSSEQVRRMIHQDGSGALDDLSSELHPVGQFIQELERKLEERWAGKKSYPVSMENWLQMQFARFAMLRQGWGSRLAILAIIIGLSVAAWNSYSGLNDPMEDRSSSPAVIAAGLPSFTHSNYTIADGFSTPTATTEPLPSFSFAPIQDDLILVDPFGQIRLFHLASGSLSDPIPGFPYSPCAHPTHKAGDPLKSSPRVPPGCNLNTIREPSYPAQISSDGRWLAITRPIEKDSWILPLDGLGSALKISSFAARFEWAPDGHALAFADPLDPGNLVSGPGLPRLARPIQGNEIDRWYDSPDGKISILVEATFRMHSPCPCLTHISSSDLAHTWLIYTGGINALAWTSDSSSLIVQVPSASGTILKRIDIKTGMSQTIADNLLLVGLRRPR